MYLFYSMNKINILIYILILLFIGLLVYYFHEKGKSLEGMTPSTNDGITYGQIPYKIYIYNDKNVKYYVKSTPKDGNHVQFSENISDAGLFHLSTVIDGTTKYSIMVTTDKKYVLRFDGSSLLVELDQLDQIASKKKKNIDQFSVTPITPAILNNDKDAIQSKLLKQYLISSVANNNVILKDGYNTDVDFYVDFKYKLEMGKTLTQYTTLYDPEKLYSPNGEYYLSITNHSLANIQKINTNNDNSLYLNLYKKQNPFPLNYSNNNLVDTEFFRGGNILYKDLNIHCDSSCSFGAARMVMGGDGNLVIIPNDDGGYNDVAWMSGTQFFEKDNLTSPFKWTSPNGALYTINSLFTIYAQVTNEGGLGIFLENTSKTINVTTIVNTASKSFTLAPTSASTDTTNKDILLRKFVPNKNSYRDALTGLPNTKGYQNMIPESGEEAICLIKIMPKTSPPKSGTTINRIDVNNHLCEWITVKADNTEGDPETTYMGIISEITGKLNGGNSNNQDDGGDYDVIAMYYGPNSTKPYQMNGWIYNEEKIQPNIKNCPAPVKKIAPAPAPVVKKSAPAPAPVSAPAPALALALAQGQSTPSPSPTPVTPSPSPVVSPAPSGSGGFSPAPATPSPSPIVSPAPSGSGGFTPSPVTPSPSPIVSPAPSGSSGFSPSPVTPSPSPAPSGSGGSNIDPIINPVISPAPSTAPKEPIPYCKSPTLPSVNNIHVHYSNTNASL